MYVLNNETVSSDLMWAGIVFQSLGQAIVKALSVEVFCDLGSDSSVSSETERRPGRPDTRSWIQHGCSTSMDTVIKVLRSCVVKTFQDDEGDLKVDSLLDGKPVKLSK